MKPLHKPAIGALGKLATTGDLRKATTPPRDSLAKIAADYAEIRKSIAPMFEKLAKLEARVEEVARETTPPSPLRKIVVTPEPQPAVDPGYDQVATLLEKLAREGMGEPLANAARVLRERSDSAQALAAAAFNDIPNRSRT